MPPLLQHHATEGTIASKNVTEWLLQIQRLYNIPMRVNTTQLTSPSKATKTVDERCRNYATFLFFKRRSALSEVEYLLSRTAAYNRSTAELCRLLREEYVQCYQEIFDRTPTEPATSQEQVRAVEAIPLRLSQVTPASSNSISNESSNRPSTPTEPDSDVDYQTAPVSPSACAALKSDNRKRPSPSSHHGNSARRKLSRTESLPPNYSPKLAYQPLKSQIVSFNLSQSASQSFPGNSAAYPSFETELTIPDQAPPSSALFGPTSSDHRAFSQLQPESMPGRKSGATEENSSILYAVSSNMQDAMHRAANRHEVAVHESSVEADHSVTLEDYRIRKLAQDGFFFDDERVNSPLPFAVQYECARVSLEADLDFRDCLEATPADLLYHSFWTAMDRLCHANGKSCYHTPEKVWQSHVAEVGLTMKLFLTPKRKSLMRLSLMPRDLQKHSRFHKKFGASRFLTVYLPDFRTIEKDKGSSMLPQRLNEWLMNEKNWLGRQWRALYVEPVKSKDSMNTKQEKFSYRAMFFATSGRDVEPVSVEQCISWFIDINGSENLKSPFCKIYSRIHLGFSNTHTGYEFHPAQVREVPDIRASDHSEPIRYNDMSSCFNWAQPTGSGQTMNDGCSLISLAAAVEVWKKLGHSGPVPSIFQARINGAKGVWIRSADPSTASADDKRIWIEINESQRKFSSHPEDFRGGQSSQGYEPLRWSFEVLSWSRVAKPSTLHQSFLPILVDRGVPRRVIEQLVTDSLDEEHNRIVQCLNDPVHLRSWLAKNGGSNNQLDTLQTCGAMPTGLAGCAVMLLESGFEPQSNTFLAEQLYDVFWSHFARVIRAFCVALAQSTVVKGIADWTGTLKPGEIHLAFSRPFITGDLEECHFLNGQEVLTTRHPCLRASDIQKVVARYAIELSHVRDVVVFSTLGPEPLANKLQGGDYDGDDYWVCWDSRLTSPFLNAPSPISLPDPEELGIQIDRRSLAQVMFAEPNDCYIDNFLKVSFAFSLQPSLLGLVTDYHERLSYKTNDLHNRGAMLLADLHSIIIDSTKNGYTYTRENFLAWMKRHKIIGATESSGDAGFNHLPERAWKSSIDSWDGRHRRAKKKVREGKSMSFEVKPAPVPKLEHILDYIHFEVILPRVEQTLLHVERLHAAGHAADSHLVGIYDDLIRGEEHNDDVRQMVDALKMRLNELYDAWSKPSSTPFEDKVAFFHRQFVELQPRVNRDQHHTDYARLIDRWMNDAIGYRPTTWTLLKASLLYSSRAKNSCFVWHVAGDVLCYIKAQHFPKTRSVVQAQYLNLKAKKIKMTGDGVAAAGEVVRIEDSAEYESYQDDETEFFSISER